MFIAQCTGNGGDVGGDCTVTEPGGIPSVFTVGGFGEYVGLGFYSGCDDWDDCEPTLGTTRYGGGDIKNSGGTNMPASQSMVDVLGPGYLNNLTEEDGTYGTIKDGTAGCSIATPYVAGTAAVVKEFFLSDGASWINAPAELHAVMLAMGDRRQGGGQVSSNADDLWGFGLLKARLFEATGGLAPYGYQQYTVAFTAQSGTYSASLNGGSPLPGGAALVKCSIHQVELLDGTDRVSNIDLELMAYNPAAGSCAVLGLPAGTTVTDGTTDTQGFAAIDSGVGGKCIRMRLYKTAINTWGVTAHVFCYFAGANDAEPS